jgi:hypothetical protein
MKYIQLFFYQEITNPIKNLQHWDFKKLESNMIFKIILKKGARYFNISCTDDVANSTTTYDCMN